MENVAGGSDIVKYVFISEQIAEGMTKPQAKEKFLIFQKAFGLEAYPWRNTWLDILPAWIFRGGLFFKHVIDLT